MGLRSEWLWKREAEPLARMDFTPNEQPDEHAFLPSAPIFHAQHVSDVALTPGATERRRARTRTRLWAVRREAVVQPSRRARCPARTGRLIQGARMLALTTVKPQSHGGYFQPEGCQTPAWQQDGRLPHTLTSPLGCSCQHPGLAQPNTQPQVSGDTGSVSFQKQWIEGGKKK